MSCLFIFFFFFLIENRFTLETILSVIDSQIKQRCSMYEKVVLVLDGIDSIDLPISNDPHCWFPSQFPSTFRVILTGSVLSFSRSLFRSSPVSPLPLFPSISPSSFPITSRTPLPPISSSIARAEKLLSRSQ